MRRYDVYYGQELQTSLLVHDDGRVTWEDSPERRRVFCSENEKGAIAETINRYPDQETFIMRPLKIQRRRECAESPHNIP